MSERRAHLAAAISREPLSITIPHPLAAFPEVRPRLTASRRRTAGGVGFDAGAALVEGARPRAAFVDGALAGGVEKGGGAFVVLEDVPSLEEPQRRLPASPKLPTVFRMTIFTERATIPPPQDARLRWFEPAY